MIRLTRLNGSEFSLNPDLIHRAEETPDTVLTLIDGSRYVVLEPLEELITRVVGYRARVVAQAGMLAEEALTGPHDTAERPRPRAQVLAAVPADEPDDRDDDHGDDHGDDHDGRRTGASVVRLRARRA